METSQFFGEKVRFKLFRISYFESSFSMQGMSHVKPLQRCILPWVYPSSCIAQLFQQLTLMATKALIIVMLIIVIICCVHRAGNDALNFAESDSSEQLPSLCLLIHGCGTYIFMWKTVDSLCNTSMSGSCLGRNIAQWWRTSLACTKSQGQSSGPPIKEFQDSKC